MGGLKRFFSVHLFLVVSKLLQPERESFEHLVGVAHLLPRPPEIRYRNLGDKVGLFLERVSLLLPFCSVVIGVTDPPEIRYCDLGDEVIVEKSPSGKRFGSFEFPER